MSVLIIKFVYSMNTRKALLPCNVYPAYDQASSIKNVQSEDVTQVFLST